MVETCAGKIPPSIRERKLYRPQGLCRYCIMILRYIRGTGALCAAGTTSAHETRLCETPSLRYGLLLYRPPLKLCKFMRRGCENMPANTSTSRRRKRPATDPSNSASSGRVLRRYRVSGTSPACPSLQFVSRCIRAVGLAVIPGYPVICRFGRADFGLSKVPFLPTPPSSLRRQK